MTNVLGFFLTEAQKSELSDELSKKETCWLCFNTGKIVDHRIDDLGNVTAGPDCDKPCLCGRKPNENEA